MKRREISKPSRHENSSQESGTLTTSDSNASPSLIVEAQKKLCTRHMPLLRHTRMGGTPRPFYEEEMTRRGPP